MYRQLSTFQRSWKNVDYLRFYKKDDDRRNTYVEVTEEGEKLLLEMNTNYYDSKHDILEGSLPIKDLYGKFPEFLEVMSVVRNIYGEDFMEIFERGFEKIKESYDDSTGEMKAISHTNSNEELKNPVFSIRGKLISF